MHKIKAANPFSRTAFYFVVTLCLVGCVTGSNSSEPKAMATKAGPESVVKTSFGPTVVKKRGTMYISGQPQSDAFAAAKAAGVKTVINLREPSEYKSAEAQQAKTAGIRYFNVPVSGRGVFKKEAFEKIDALVAQYGKEPIWVHCSSGNRAGAWYASHLILVEHMDQDEALQIAHQIGVTQVELDDRILDYVNGVK